eukprot:12921945-Prorocentrum_lima.AAC.1
MGVPDLAQLFQRGGNCSYTDGDLHGQEEILRVSAEYVSFSRGQGEAVEEAIARFDMLHAVAVANGVAESNPINLALKIIRAFCVPT